MFNHDRICIYVFLNAIIGTSLRYERQAIREMNDIVKTSIFGDFYDVNRLTPYFNQLHAYFSCIF